MALPLLDAMVPALTAMAQTAARPVRRLGFVYIPMGMNPVPWTPTADGRITELSPSLASLAPYLDHLTVVSNLEVRNSAVAGGNHATAGSAFLSCARAKRTEGSDFELGVDGRPDRRQAGGRRHADPVARDRHRPDRAGRQLRQRLRLRVSEQPVVGIGDRAVAERSGSAPAVRAAVRRRRHARCAPRRTAPERQHSRLGARRHGAARRQARRRAIAGG